MKKQLLIIFFCAIHYISLNAQQFSPEAKFLMEASKTLEQEQLPTSLNGLHKVFALRWQDNALFASGFFKVNAQINKKRLQAQGIEIGTQVGNILTARFPISALKNMKNMPGLEEVTVDYLVTQTVDSVRKFTGADKVHNGEGLDKPYTGKGVLVGIVDGGYDFTHPLFRKNNSDTLRVLAYWNHNDTTNSNPPAGYTYGKEVWGWQNILAEQKDGTGSHGTHVSGIAAGSKIPGLETGQGMAPDADFIIVSTTFAGSSILDGVAYIYKVADSLNRPVVVNLSLGGSHGLRDGESPFDLACDTLLQTPRRALCGAMGNEGGQNSHFYHRFTSSHDTARTVIPMNVDTATSMGSIFVDMWGDPYTSFKADIEVLDTLGNVLKKLNKFIRPTVQGFMQLDSLIIIDGTWQTKIELYSQGLDYTVTGKNRPNIKFLVNNPFPERYFVGLVLTSNNMGVHCWNGGKTFADTVKNGVIVPNYLHGDDQYTLRETGSTGKSIISVGAYTSMNEYVNIHDSLMKIPVYSPVGDTAKFTNQGPSIDGRMKPDVSSPGNNVVAGFSSYDAAPDSNSFVRIYSEGSNRWAYAAWWGTSMATPGVTGTVALMFEANPNLSQTEIKGILHKTAIEDNFTGNLPEAGDPLWGWGKLNAFGAVDSLAAEPTSILPTKTFNHALLFPNPINELANVRFELIHDQAVSLYVINSIGQKTELNSQQNMAKGTHILPFSMKNLPNGMYIIELVAGKESLFFRTTKQ